MLHLAATQDSVPQGSATDAARGQVNRTPSEQEVQQLGFLRARALRVRVAPRVEPFHFCALIEADPHREAASYADALMHVLPQAIGRPILFRRPGIQSPSFDEAWVLSIVASAQRGDEASLLFALASRCAAPFRRPIAFLVKG
ncbi:MAG: hypothetical protein AAF698_09545, partial [Pseudomonadota bacterium]